jgi:hypothetical protein
MGNQSEIIYVPGSDRFKGNTDKDLFVQVPLQQDYREFIEGDRSVLLNLEEIFDFERQLSQKFRVAGKITNLFNNTVSGKTTWNPFKNNLFYLDSVQSAYKSLYQDNLLDDLQGELSASDYQKFLTIVSSNAKKDTSNGGSAAVQFAKANQLVVAKKAVTLRSSPDATNHGAFYEVFSAKNIIRQAKPGEFLGYATGRQQFDEVNNVKFIEVAYVINAASAPAAYKSKNKVRVSFWVSSSSLYVDILPYYKNMYDAYPATKSFTGWMKPQDYFTLKGIPMPRLLTKINTPVLNEHLVPVALAQPNMILGKLIMSINTGKGEFLQFKTVDNTLRWVDKRFIQLQEQS